MFIVCVALSFVLGVYYQQLQIKKDRVDAPQAVASNNMFEIREKGYRFISPLWDCDCASPSKLNALSTLDSTLRAYVNECNNKGLTTNISVYFRDMNNGPWIGINEDEVYAPASLLKVPIMIAVYKIADDDPTFLKKKIFYKTPIDTTPVNVNENLHIVAGNYYTIQNLVEYMIIGSDNNAKQLLLDEIGIEAFDKTIQELGIYPTNSVDFVSVKMYSSFFRVLYNSSYLSKQNSEKALEVLSKSTFKNGIAAQLPEGITIANKFGERAFYNSNLKQLHDCGIIYHPQNPYLICVMTRGYDFKTQQNVIANISKLVFEGVNNSSNYQ